MSGRLQASVAAAVLLVPTVCRAQPGGGFGGPGFGGPGGFFGGGPPGQQEVKLADEFDADDDGWLNRAERDAARESLAKRPQRGRRGPPGGPFGRGNRQPPHAGRRLSPDDVPAQADKSLYDPATFRTLFLEFEEDDWEEELAAFKTTDVEVPATLTVDGVQYPQVGVKFRGMSSFMMTPAGYKRSFNVSLDLVDKRQRLDGYKTLNLLNCNGDPSLMSAALYSTIAGRRIPTALANFVQVVVNGECWGVYANVQQIDKVFTKEHFGSEGGTRWKIPGNPGADGGLRYLGEELEPYKTRFEIKSKDDPKAWRALVDLCRTLQETPADELEHELAPLLDLENALWFLALDNALVNSDGYWTRASDYYLYRDETGVFHLIAGDMNEAFHGGGGPGGPGGRRGPGGFGPPSGFGPPQRFGPPDGFGPPGDFGPPADFPPPDGFGPPRDSEAGGEQASAGEAPTGADRGTASSPGAAEPDQGPWGRRRGGPGFGPGGPGFGPGGMMHGGPDLDPLVGLDNPRMPLRSRLLSVLSLRAKYLEHVKEIAASDLNWQQLGPLVAQHRALIEDAVRQETRGLSTFDAFDRMTSSEAESSGDASQARSLRDFADKRRKFLLEYEPKAPQSVDAKSE